MKIGKCVIAGISLLMTVACKNPPKEVAIQKEESKDVDQSERFKEFTNSIAKSTPGIILFASQKGEEKFGFVDGFANYEETKLTGKESFQIGSLTKQFTAVAILKLEEEGKLKITEPVKKYLTDFNINESITLEHLLSHTSGLADYTSSLDWNDKFRKKEASPIELFKLIENSPSNFKCGERFEYNNLGYVLLGEIIQRVSGLAYGKYLKENLLIPAKMTQSGYMGERELPDRFMQGYELTEEGVTAPMSIHISQPFSAGGMYSSKSDLIAWYEALSSGQIIRSQTLHKAWEPFKLNNGKPSSYGFGWYIGNIGGKKTVEHSGGIPGYSAYLIYVPKEGVLTFQVTNCMFCPSNMFENVSEMAKILLDVERVEKLRQATDETKEVEIEGYFQDSWGDEYLRIYSEEEKLYLLKMGEMRKELFRVGEGSWQTEDGDEVKKKGAEFVLNPRIGVTSIWMRRNENPFEGEIEEMKTEEFSSLIGRYGLPAGYSFEIIEDQGVLFMNCPWGEHFQLFENTKGTFLIKEVDIELFPKEGGTFIFKAGKEKLDSSTKQNK